MLFLRHARSGERGCHPNLSNMKRLAIALLAAATATACQVDYHPYDTRIDGECGINAKNIARIEASTAGKSAIRFAVISDTQRWYDETREAVSALNARGDIDFVLHTGDMADFGMKAEFERQRDILNRLHVPYVVLLGNHDCLATGEEIFRTIFGDFNTAFTAGNVRILCLNTNALEFDLREAVPNFEFIETELTEFPPEASKTIVAMHAKPYTEQFGDNVAKGIPVSRHALSGPAVLHQRARTQLQGRGPVRRRRALPRVRQHRQEILSAVHRKRRGLCVRAYRILGGRCSWPPF